MNTIGLPILIAADKSNADALANEVFEGTSFNITTVDRIEDIFKLLRASHYKLLVIDFLSLSAVAIDTIELIRRVNEQTKHTDLIIVATSVEDDLTALKLLRAGASRAMNKVRNWQEWVGAFVPQLSLVF